MNRERNKSGFFIRNKSKKSKRHSFFKKLNNDRKNTSHQNADLLDHNQYTHHLTDIGCEVVVDELIIDSDKNNTWMEGRRVVELDVLAREMHCCRCNLPLHLSNTVGERLYGLASVLLIKCDNSACLATTDVHTGKRTPNGSYCINSKVAIGMTHAGMGPSHVNNFLTECNLPPISDTTLRKKEKEFSKTIHDVAMTSCREAQHQEILLSHGKVAASFDGGWQKRGSGWNYNSNTGHATMIGKETGKIMLWDQRSRSCKTCEYHLANQTTIPDHLCLKNIKFHKRL
ncbi:uncharacterized protein LOC134696828 [Mytilus trossulus]|uniref:uncharacterized protein LOC134696828 n=1 Tax=Mytilus trossulus TaxID=6551 RepID=UPI003006C9C7